VTGIWVTSLAKVIASPYPLRRSSVIQGIKAAQMIRKGQVMGTLAELVRKTMGLVLCGRPTPITMHRHPAVLCIYKLQHFPDSRLFPPRVITRILRLELVRSVFGECIGCRTG
jgi:hypothetical protein